MPPETCPACRFDGAVYGVQDALGTLRAISPMWRQMADGIADDVLVAPAPPDGWSVVDHAAHSADVATTVGHVLERLLSEDDPRIDVPEAADRDVSDGIEGALARLHAGLDRIHVLGAAIGGGRDPRWALAGTVGGARLDIAWVLRHAIHDATHHHRDAGRALHLLGAGAPTQEGTVAQLNVSDGGVPKRPVESVEIGDRGLAGDRQASRKHHGRPLQALCLWSSELIDALRAEGHPIEAGSAGENVTISGVEWSTLRSGVQLLVGDVLAEVSAYATPCKKNAQWFAGGRFDRMAHDTHPGWSRLYAWVREPGTVTTGDRVVVEP